MRRAWRGALLALAVGGCATSAADGPGDALAAAFDCARERGATLVSAHRGGPGPGLPENALKTLAQSVAGGVFLLEIDVRRTADGALVLMHDATLERTTTGAGAVAETTLAALRALRLEDPVGAAVAEAPPSLAEALAWAAGRAVLQLDVKRGAPLADVVAAVRAAGAQDRVVVIVYSAADAATLARLAPELMVSASIEDGAALAAMQAAGLRADRLLAWTGTRRPDPALWAALRAAGIEPMFGTLGGADSLDRRIAAAGDEGAYAALARQGLSVIGTDRPAAAQGALEAAGIGPSRAAECFTGIIGGT